MKSDRSSKPRGKPGAAPARGGPRKPTRSFGDAGARRYGAPPARPARPVRDRAETSDRARPVRDRGESADPYQPARRPARAFNTRTEGGDRGERFPRSEPPRRFAPERGSSFGDRERSARGFTVTLDPDVARVFRGDASVNKALRLVLQLMQVVQGPPPARAERPRGYQGSPEARGFDRKPRFEENEDTPDESDA